MIGGRSSPRAQIDQWFGTLLWFRTRTGERAMRVPSLGEAA